MHWKCICYFFVFWQKRLTLRQTSYLLINLAVSDLLVGVWELISLASGQVPNLFGVSFLKDTLIPLVNFITASLTIFFSSSSSCCLALISIERAFSVLRPIRHRTVSLRVYFGAITFAWTAGMGTSLIFLIPVFSASDKMPSTVAVNVVYLLSISLVCTGYLTICKYLKRTHPYPCNQNRSYLERNKKLSQTLLLVIGLSLVCWLPGLILYTLGDFCPVCISAPVMLTGRVLHLANSAVNPVTYSFRMPIFRESLRRLLRVQEHRGNR